MREILEAVEADATSVGDLIKCSDPTVHVRKVRIGCPKESVPPRKGYRLIFQVLCIEGRPYVRLLDCYYKPEQSDIAPEAVARLINIAPAIALAAVDDEL